MADIRPDTQNRVQLRPVTDAKLEAQDFGQEKIGRGLAGFGQNLTQVAQDWDDINAIHNEAAVKETDNGALAKELALIREIESLKGKDALLANERYAERMDAIRKDALSKLTNDRQKRMFTDVFDRRAISNNDRVSRFATKVTFDYNIAATEGQIDTHIARAADVYDEADPSEFDASVLTIINATKQRGALKGNDDDMTKADVEKFVGSAYAAVVERIAVEDAIKARKFIDAHAGKLPADVETKLRVRLQPAWLEMRAEEVADAAIAGVADLGLNSAVEDVTAAEGVKPDPAKTEENLKINQWPLRDYGKSRVKGGQFGAPRDGGTRAHGGLDYPAPSGTPVLPRLRGKVIEVDTVGKTDAGFYVKVKYADGHVGSYSHLRNINVNPGDDVDTDTVIGGVGGTGKGGKSAYGSHLHEVIRGPDGKAINPENYKPKGVLADPAQQGYGPKYDGNTVDIKAAYALIEKQYQQGDISLALRKEAMRAIDDRARREDVVKDREYDAARDQAAEAIVGILESGGTLLDPAKQIPNWADQHPDFKIQLLGQAQSNIAARDAAAKAAAVEGSFEHYLTVLGMANTAPSDFLALDLTEYKDRYSKAQYQRLVEIQTQYRQQGTYRPELAPSLSRVNGLLAPFFKEADIDAKEAARDPRSVAAKRKTYLTDLVLSEIDARQQAGRKMSDSEIIVEIVRPQLRRVVSETPWLFTTRKTEMPWYEAERTSKPGERPVSLLPQE